MRNVMVVLVGLSFIVMLVGDAHASWFGKKEEGTKGAQGNTQAAVTVKQEAPKKEQPLQPSAPKTDKAKQEAANAKRALVEKKKLALNNTEWQLDLTPMSGTEKKETEVLAFASNQIYFPNFVKRGFPQTNYTLTAGDGGPVVWETMQTSEKNGIAFWRGEVDSEMQTMRGVLSHQLPDGTSKDYSFVTTSKKTIPPPQDKTEEK